MTRIRLNAGLRGTEPDDLGVPRITRLLALAHRWHRLIDAGEIRDQAEIARRTGLTRARVTQIMELRWLPPQIQAEAANGLLAPDSERRWRGQGYYWPDRLLAASARAHH